MADHVLPCTQCDARCCYQYIVGITGFDAWRISHGMHLGWEEFLMLAKESKSTPVGFMLDKNTETTYDLMLGKVKNFEVPFTTATMKKGFKPELEKSACVFLINLPNGFGRCGIYDYRPGCCRTYPVGHGNGVMHLRPNLPCPPNGWNLALMDLPVWRKQGMQYDMEISLYHYLVSVWNTRLKAGSQPSYSPGDYYAFMNELYDRVVPVRNQVSDWMPIYRYWQPDDPAKLTEHPVLKRALEALSPQPLYDEPAPEDAWSQFVYGFVEAVLTAPFIRPAGFKPQPVPDTVAQANLEKAS